MDVLGILDAAIDRETEGGFVFPVGRSLSEVRAAVAELADAARVGQLLKTAETGEQYALFGVVATARLRAALAKFQVAE